MFHYSPISKINQMDQCGTSKYQCSPISQIDQNQDTTQKNDIPELYQMIKDKEKYIIFLKESLNKAREDCNKLAQQQSNEEVQNLKKLLDNVNEKIAKFEVEQQHQISPFTSNIQSVEKSETSSQGGDLSHSKSADLGKKVDAIIKKEVEEQPIIHQQTQLKNQNYIYDLEYQQNVSTSPKQYSQQQQYKQNQLRMSTHKDDIEQQSNDDDKSEQAPHESNIFLEYKAMQENKIKEQDEQINKMKMEIKQKDEQLIKFQEEIRQMNLTIENQLIEIKNSQEQQKKIIEQDNEIKQLNEQLEDSRQKLQSCIIKCQELQQPIQVKDDSPKEKGQKKNQIKQQKEQLEKQLKDCKELNKQIQNQLNTSNQKIQALEKDLVEVKQNHYNEKTQYQNEKKQVIESLQKQLNECQQNNNYLNQQLAMRDQSIHGLNDEISKIINAENYPDSNISKILIVIEQQTKKLTQKLQQYEQNNKPQLEENLENYLKIQNGEFENTIKEQEQKIISLNSEIEQQKKTNEQLQKKINELECRGDQLQKFQNVAKEIQTKYESLQNINQISEELREQRYTFESIQNQKQLNFEKEKNEMKQQFQQLLNIVINGTKNMVQLFTRISIKGMDIYIQLLIFYLVSYNEQQQYIHDFNNIQTQYNEISNLQLDNTQFEKFFQSFNNKIQDVVTKIERNYSLFQQQQLQKD